MVPDGNNNLGKDSSTAGRSLTRKGEMLFGVPCADPWRREGNRRSLEGISGRQFPN